MSAKFKGKRSMSNRVGLSMQLLSMFAALFLVCFGGYIEANAGERLSGEEIEAVLSGNSITGKGFTLYYDTSGEVRGIEGGDTDTGKWWAESDKFCVQWNNWMNAKKLCMYISQEGPLLHRANTAGTYSDVVELREGNPKGL